MLNVRVTTAQMISKCRPDLLIPDGKITIDYAARMYATVPNTISFVELDASYLILSAIHVTLITQSALTSLSMRRGRTVNSTTRKQ